MAHPAEELVMRHQSSLRRPVNLEERTNEISEGYGPDPNNCANDDTVFRIMSINCRGLPVESTTPKNQVIYEFISTYRPDAIGFSEVNVNWKYTPDRDRLPQRTRGWFQSLHISNAYNYHERTPQRFQYGGTSHWSIDSGAHRVCESGKDPSGLGRWSWTKYRGKSDLHLKIFTVYVPCDQHKGPQSVYTQQVRHFVDINRDMDPVEAF